MLPNRLSLTPVLVNTKGPDHHQVCLFLYVLLKRTPLISPSSHWFRAGCLSSKPSHSSRRLRRGLGENDKHGWPGVELFNWLTEQVWLEVLPGSGYKEQEKQASMRNCGHPPTLLTEEHASDGLSIRKMCPFPQWISAHLCPKTVPHAFLCMWTWESSAKHQQDVSFAFPMWWAIPTFTHFPCKNRTSPWLVRIRDVAVAKEKFSSVEANPQGGLNPQSRASSTVFWGQSP